MARKILGWFVLVLLFVGTICGVVFGAKYAEVGGRTAEENIFYIQTLETRIDDLEEERIQLLLGIAELEEDNAYTQQLRAEVSELTAEIEALKEELAYTKQLLEAYQDSEKHIVEFYADGELFDILLVDPGDCVNVNLLEEPTKLDHRFDGWAIERTTDIVDFASLPITADTTFEAVFSPTKEVLFSGEKVISFGDGQSLYTGTITKMLSTEFADISFSNDIQVTLKASLHAQSGEAGSCEKTTLQANKNTATLTSVYGDWGELRLTTNGALVIDLTDLYSVYYGSFTIYEIVKIL